mmetsp:Transcript_32879/g.77105  ORF Transcript_32879/g.77105 Transcript_32879/m.77105 type:complete len:178 (+) Transcript_32879:436-969(+)
MSSTSWSMRRTPTAWLLVTDNHQVKDNVRWLLEATGVALRWSLENMTSAVGREAAAALASFGVSVVDYQPHDRLVLFDAPADRNSARDIQQALLEMSALVIPDILVRTPSTFSHMGAYFARYPGIRPTFVVDDALNCLPRQCNAPASHLGRGNHIMLSTRCFRFDMVSSTNLDNGCY